MEIKTIRPVEEFIASLDGKAIAKVLKSIRLLGEFGHMLSMPQSRKVADQLFELRIRGGQEVRIFYTFYEYQACLLHGFIKKSQKTPKKELEVALKRKRLLTMYNL